MSTISKRQQKTKSLTLERFDRGMGAPVLLGMSFFFILCLGAPDSGKGVVLFAAAVMLIVVAARFQVLRDRIYLPFFALALYVLMDGISTFYAISGKFALREFLKVFLAFMMAVVLLAISPKKEEQKGKRIAAILAICTAVGSLVGIDMFSTGWISGAVVWVLNHFTRMYAAFGGGTVFAYSRMASIFENSNICAGFSGLGILLCLGLATGALSKKERCFYLILLYLNAVTFILTISFGAFFFVFLAVIVFVLMQKKENRFRALALVLETLIVAAAAAVLVYKLAGREPDGPRFFLALCIALCAAALCGIDLLAGRWITDKAASYGKATVIVLAALIVLMIAYGVAALFVTWPISMEADSSIWRMTFLKPGTYTVDVQADGGPLTLTVWSRTREQDGANTSTELFQGDALGASFTVPEDSVVVNYRFTASDAAYIRSAKFGDHKVPLEYKLLPQLIVWRLQDPSTSTSVSQRIIYLRDGLKLFRRGPVFGLGMGAFENGFKSVQTYFYETKYVHNHYLQTMLDTGIIGLILFLFLLISSAIAIWKSRKEQPFVPMLAAAWVFMAGQAMHDIVFSAYAYLPLAYGCFAMINLCCGEAIAKPRLGKTFKVVLIAGLSLLSVLYCGFVASNLMANQYYKRDSSFQSLTKCVKMDRFEWADYALQYVYSATDSDMPASIRKQADEYAERLAGVSSNAVSIYLAEYYFINDRPEQALAMLEKHVDYCASNQNAWREAFDMLRNHQQDTEVFRDGVLRLAEKMETWNANNFGKVFLTDEQTAFVEAYR